MNPPYLRLRSLLVLLFCGHAADAQTDCILPVTGGKPFAVGDLPVVIDIGDLDGDGSLDIVASSFGSTDVSVLLGNGDGSFAEQVVYDAPYPATTGVAIVDLDEDGNLDVLTSNLSGTVSVFLGSGDGTFGPGTAFPATNGNALRLLDVGDLNNDGDIDVAVTRLDATVIVLLGNGDGTLGFPQSFGVSPDDFVETGDVAIADLDGDGNGDLVVGGSHLFIDPDSIYVLPGDGTGDFPISIPYVTGGNSAGRIHVDDLNNDTVPDISAANIQSDTISVLLGNGDGTFGSATAFNAGVDGPGNHDVGDVDGDGELDVVVPGRFSSTVGILLGNGDGTFQPPVEIPAGSIPVMVRLADFDGVGGLDLAVVDTLADVVLIMLNTCPCGNGILDKGEVCDGGPCCSPVCTYRPSGTTCRASQGPCDPFAEVCTGTSEFCPEDVVSPAGTVCAPTTSVCEIDGVCDGSGPVCPGATPIVECVDDDGCCPAGSLCNATNDNDCDPICGNAVIEPGEDCDGGECCNRRCAFAAAGTVCNPAATPCELDATCNGVGLTCPVNPPNAQVACIDGDGCCPLDGHCDANLDNDCRPICGNGATEFGEACDDGNLDSCDGCTPDCLFEVPCVSIPTVTYRGLSILVLGLAAAIAIKCGRRQCDLR